ncbi:MAG: thioredoxin [Candidatus Omnitrophica bacterium]|nr:thioredoxin [Candidatus Omnitrophota bacterium]
MEKPLTLTDKNFEEEVLKSSIPVLVDFWASWCPPCKMMEVILTELLFQLNGSIRVAKINVDQNQTSAACFNISGVPTIILFDEGREIKRLIGAHSKLQLVDMINEEMIKIKA